ncbi:uncharacterized protein LOC144097182 [Amblyomma americanum]
MANASAYSLPCFSLDEKILQLLWDEGVQMEELLEFSFERVGRFAAERGVDVDDDHKDELWRYVQRMKAEQPDWLSLSQYHDRTSRQLFDSCQEDITGDTLFHTAQLSWDPLPQNDSCRASLGHDSTASTAIPGTEVDSDVSGSVTNPKPSKRTCKTPKTFRLSKCDLSPITSATTRAPVRRSGSKRAALLAHLVRDRTTEEDRFFTRGIWPAWLSFSPARPKESSPTSSRIGQSSSRSRRQRTPFFLRWIGRKRSHGYRVSSRSLRQLP